MSAAKHTPGPWHFVRSYSPTTWDCIVGDKARRVVVFANDVKDDDARLIAAAPELLDALKACAAILSGNEMTKSGLIDALTLTRVAIARATGEPT